MSALDSRLMDMELIGRVKNGCKAMATEHMYVLMGMIGHHAISPVQVKEITHITKAISIMLPVVEQNCARNAFQLGASDPVKKDDWDQLQTSMEFIVELFRTRDQSLMPVTRHELVAIARTKIEVVKLRHSANDQARN